MFDRRPVRSSGHSIRRFNIIVAACFVLLWGRNSIADGDSFTNQLVEQYSGQIVSLIQKYCAECHSATQSKGDLDLARFTTAEHVRGDTRVWQKVLRRLVDREMPPQDSSQPSPEERQQLIGWTDSYLKAVARRHAGDPGLVLMRRLTRAEYNYTIRDLTGVDLRPAEKFPEDSVAGEGFANTGESLIMAPELLPGYLDAARMVAAHTVLTPSGLRFAPIEGRANWTAALVDRLRSIYARYTSADGTLALNEYIEATLQFRERSQENEHLTLEQLAGRRDLSTTYVHKIWEALHDPEAASDVARLAGRWRSLQPGQGADLVREIILEQARYWRINQERTHMVGSIGVFGRYLIAQEKDPVDATGSSLPALSIIPRPQTANQPVSCAELFPPVFCFPAVVPINKDVTVDLFLRDDEPFGRLLLNASEKQELDRLWDELVFVAQSPIHELGNAEEILIHQLPNSSRTENIRRLKELIPKLTERSTEFRTSTLVAAQPRQLDAMVRIAVKAWRRPLESGEETALRKFYESLREEQQMLHEDAIRTLLVRILVSPKFLYRIERPVGQKQAVPISDWELASRLSYFLWSSLPDERLKILAAAGRLQDPVVLRSETERMLVDPRVQALSIEFAGQWLQTRGFAEHAGKSEVRFPTYTPDLRKTLGEEPVRFITDMIQNDRSVLELLRAQHTFLNEQLAHHYNIPGVEGDVWLRVDGVDRHGRGGLLAMGSVLARQSGALRTSPVLRGTWVVETLLGRHIPNPPDDIPQLTEDGANKAGLSMRQLVRQHRADSACAGCHEKIDPYGFALEQYDPVGRLRDYDASGNLVETRADLPDGSTLQGLNGLQNYLLDHKEEFLRQFSRKILGYALGRTIELSDETLLTEMYDQLVSNEYQFSAAVLTIIQSNQFCRHRGPVDTSEPSPP